MSVYTKTYFSTSSHPSGIWGWVYIEFANRPQESLHLNSELSHFSTCYNMYLISLSSICFVGIDVLYIFY